MSKEQPAEATVENAQRTLGEKTILNCTKVVRLFLLDPENGRTTDFLRATENATRADIFVDRTKLTREGPHAGTQLMAMSIGLRDVVPHKKAHEEHHGSIVVLKAADGDQVEWQCDVPFKVLKITMVKEHTHGFHTHGHPPEYPFTKNLEALTQREPSAPIRSGALKRGHWKQLYKAEFELEIDGQRLVLDPDFYCEGHP